MTVVEEARQLSGGRAASASERVSRPPRGCGSSSGWKAQRRGEVRRVVAPASRGRVCLVGSADPAPVWWSSLSRPSRGYGSSPVEMRS